MSAATITAKSVATFGVSAASYKYLGGVGTSRSLLFGGISGVSVYTADNVIGLIPQLGSLFSFLQTYAMDGVSSLIASVAIVVFSNYKSAEKISMSVNAKSLVMHFLYNLGATIVGGYIAPSIASLTG